MTVSHTVNTENPRPRHGECVGLCHSFLQLSSWFPAIYCIYLLFSSLSYSSLVLSTLSYSLRIYVFFYILFYSILLFSILLYLSFFLSRHVITTTIVINTAGAGSHPRAFMQAGRHNKRWMGFHPHKCSLRVQAMAEGR